MAKVPLTIDLKRADQKEISFLTLEDVANGAKLGFLIYPPERQIYVYRPDQIPQRVDNPPSISANPEVPGFTLDLTKIWQ